MKTLLLNPPKHWNGMYVSREEYGIGLVPTDFLPSGIFLAAAYLCEKGKDADALDAEASDVSFEGYAGWVHGGVIASLMDGAMTNCMFAQGVPVVTAELNVRFRHPVATDKAATVRAWVDQSSPPLYLLKAEVAQAEQIKATACGKFMEYPRVVAGGSVFR